MKRKYRDFHDSEIKVDATFKNIIDPYDGKVAEILFDKYVQTYDIEFSVDNLEDIFNNQTVEYPDPEEDKRSTIRKRNEGNLWNMSLE